jgi:mitochondrial Rho GTPase 1
MPRPHALHRLSAPRFFLCFLPCSAKTLESVSEVFECAQKFVIFPTWPILDVSADDFTPKCRRVLSRIFTVFDRDRDGVLSDDEMNELQFRCFKSRLGDEDLKGVKKIVSKNVENGLRGQGITLAGFLGIVKIFLDNSQVDMPWTMLRELGYNDELDLEFSEEYKEALRKAAGGPADACELTPDALAFLRRVFEQHTDTGAGAGAGMLGAAQVQRIFGVVPEPGAPVWEAAGEGRWIKPRCLCLDEGGGLLDEAAWLAMWQLAAALNPEVAVHYLYYLGLQQDPHAVLRSCRRWRRSKRAASWKKKKPPARRVYHAVLLGRDRHACNDLMRRLCGLPGEDVEEALAASGGDSASPQACAVRLPSRGGDAAGSGAGGDEATYLVVTAVPYQADYGGSGESLGRADVALVLYDPGAPESVAAAMGLQSQLPDCLPRLFVSLGAAAEYVGSMPAAMREYCQRNPELTQAVALAEGEGGAELGWRAVDLHVQAGERAAHLAKDAAGGDAGSLVGLGVAALVLLSVTAFFFKTQLTDLWPGREHSPATTHRAKAR